MLRKPLRWTEDEDRRLQKVVSTGNHASVLAAAKAAAGTVFPDRDEAMVYQRARRLGLVEQHPRRTALRSAPVAKPKPSREKILMGPPMRRAAVTSALTAAWPEGLSTSEMEVQSQVNHLAVTISSLHRAGVVVIAGGGRWKLAESPKT